MHGGLFSDPKGIDKFLQRFRYLLVQQVLEQCRALTVNLGNDPSFVTLIVTNPIYSCLPLNMQGE
ncbi:MAG: hypothetical protein AMS16_05720 [Planctomycetes bacterium DG_58]|nr:MAG: hypothetical protein AMS16_05720 [Planctomycetes bacterium DG_58]